jgi:hypothetical protein
MGGSPSFFLLVRPHLTEMHGFHWVVSAGLAGWRVFRFGPDQITLENVERLVVLVTAAIPAIQETTQAVTH